MSDTYENETGSIQRIVTDKVVKDSKTFGIFPRADSDEVNAENVDYQVEKYKGILDKFREKKNLSYIEYNSYSVFYHNRVQKRGEPDTLVNVYSGMLGRNSTGISSELYFVVETIKFGQEKSEIAILELRDRLSGSGMDGRTVPMWRYDTQTSSFGDPIMVQTPRDTRLTYDDYKESIFSEKVTKNDPFLEIASTVNSF